MSKNKQLTLKEAAKISGYSPDYIGQLIREGKLPGKQVYSNVAWVTTEEAITKYMEKRLNLETGNTWYSKLKTRLILKNKLSKVYKISLYLIVVIGIIFSLLLFYILAVGIDKNIEHKTLQKAVQSGSLQVENDS